MPEIKLIPTGISKSNPSGGERKIFAAFQRIKIPTTAYCLHSLNIPEHISRKAECEIDFIYICENGVFCFEVKSGEVSRKGGVWEFKDRFGGITKKIEGPFEQVKKNMYSLRQRLLRRFGEHSIYAKTTFGYGVFFSDILFREQSVEWDSDIVCDKPMLELNFDSYLERVMTYWSKKKNNARTISEIEMDELIEYLRGDFEFSVPLSDYLKRTESELIKLTEEQCRTLSALESNQRILISGAAGTGKTLLALERIKYQSRKGKKVLFVCFSPYLARYINAICDKFQERNLISVTNFAGIVDYFCKTKQTEPSSFPLKLTKYEEADAQEINRVSEILHRQSDLFKFDDLIVDEGQDLLKGQCLEILNCLLKDGFRRGAWAIFSDKFRQSGLHDEGDARIESALREFMPTQAELKCNCRNARSIAEETEKITRFLFHHVLHDGGAEVRPVFYKHSSTDENIFHELLNKLADDGVKADQITVLTMRSTRDFVQKCKCDSLKYELREINDENDLIKERHYVVVCSAKDFKGLENSVVILPDIERLDDVRLLYVMMTRAKSLLYIFMEEDLKRDYEKRSKEYVLNKAAMI